MGVYVKGFFITKKRQVSYRFSFIYFLKDIGFNTFLNLSFWMDKFAFEIAVYNGQLTINTKQCCKIRDFFFCDILSLQKNK